MRAFRVPRGSRRQLIDERAREGGNVIGFATGNQLTVVDDLTIFPCGAGVFEVGA